jgi:hypothetical protein
MKRRRRVLVGVFSALACLWFSGCAALSPKQQGQITSSPSGATIYFLEPETNKKTAIGSTPTEAWVKAGLFDAYLLAELDGYEPEKWELPKSGDISHYFELQKDFAASIMEENTEGRYDAEYKKAVITYLAKAEKVISSPRMLSGSMASDAKEEYQKLSIDYPQQFQSAINTVLLSIA